MARSPVLRSLITLVYAAPAALVSYHALHGLLAIGAASDAWREAFAIVAAVVSACMSWARLSALDPNLTRAGIDQLSAARLSGTVKDG